VGPRASLEGNKKSRSPPPPPGFDLGTIQSIASHYIDYAVPAHMVMNCEGWNVGHVRQMGTDKYIHNFVKTEGKGHM